MNNTLTLKDRFRLAAGRLLDNGAVNRRYCGGRTLSVAVVMLLLEGKINFPTYKDGPNLIRVVDVANQAWNLLRYDLSVIPWNRGYDASFYGSVRALLVKLRKKNPDLFDGWYNYGAGIRVN